MTRIRWSFSIALLGVLGVGCGSGTTATAPGGTSGSGKGGSSATGTGGTKGSGGTNATGTGGVMNTGGTTNTGGNAGAGGTTGSGGTTGTAGTTSGGGAAGTGGAAGAVGTLTCDDLANNNCWKTMVVEAASCLPDISVVGTLSADGSICTYASGHVITFTSPVVLPLPNDGSVIWNFTVTTPSGATCLAYSDNGNGEITLTVQAQTVRETTRGGLGISLACPDGTTYSSSDGLDPLSCPNDPYSPPPLPGASWSGNAFGVALSLEGDGRMAPDGSWLGEGVFSCETAAVP